MNGNQIDNDEDSVLCPTNPPQQALPKWVKQSQRAAKRVTTKWIRSVFREVCAQVLKHSFTNHSRISNDDKLKLVVTQQDIQACQDACQRLGKSWSEKLAQKGQRQVAEWVDAIVESNSFFDEPDEPLGLAHGATDESDANLPDQSLQPEHVVLAKLNNIGRQANMSHADCVDVIDALGRQGRTDWPYEWKIIERAAIENTKRLHTETLKGRPRVNRPKVHFELVTDGGVVIDDTNKLPKVVNRYIERKKPMKKESENTSNGRRKRQRTEPIEDQEEDTPREASSIGEPIRLLWDEEVVGSIPQVERVDLAKRMLHPEEDASEEAESNTLLGPLVEVGSIHFASKNHVDMDEKKLKRAFRRAQKERLGPHSEEREVQDPSRRWTKIKRVVSNRDKTQDWLELDLGGCLVELQLRQNEPKSLCAFSSLEISLLDKSG